MERIGIYGGMFDPPHIGHIHIARKAIEQLGLDRLYIIPDHTAPNTAKIGYATPQDRLQLTKLAFAGMEKAMVSDLSVGAPGITYTHEAVRKVRAFHPDAELFLIVGSDKLATLPNWKGFDKLMKTVCFVVANRNYKGGKANISVLSDRGAKFVELENEVLEISSSDVRRLLLFRCAGAFLPSSVAQYIQDNDLYGVWEDYKGLSMERLEQVVISLLSRNRIAHVQGCRDTAIQLAQRWGADVNDAARAGLLHDVTKALDGPLQLTVCSEYGTVLDDFSAENTKTLHAVTGSLVARDVFGENEAVVNAIRWHTTGKAGMTVLEKVLYVADYVEPNRDFPGVDDLRYLAFTDLDGALRMGFLLTLEHLKQQGADISPSTYAAVESLNIKV